MAELKSLLEKIRELTESLKSSPSEGYHAFHDLISLMLHQTVLKPDQVIGLIESDSNAFLGGSPTDRFAPLLLNDGSYLRLSVSLYQDRREHQVHMKQVFFQYQSTQDKRGRWFFRHAYLHNPSNRHSPSYVQINGKFNSEVSGKSNLPKLPEVHFPAGNRPALENAIRFMADECQVPCNSPKTTWRPLLAETEKLIYKRS